MSFDGGTNFQKAGKILEEHFPLVTTTHRAEPVTDLIFKDINQHSVMRLFVKTHPKTHAKFGGAKHSICATFKRNSRDHNNGTFVVALCTAGASMCVLQLADTNEPSVDKPLHCVRQNDNLVDLEMVPLTMRV